MGRAGGMLAPSVSRHQARQAKTGRLRVGVLAGPCRTSDTEAMRSTCHPTIRWATPDLGCAYHSPLRRLTTIQDGTRVAAATASLPDHASRTDQPTERCLCPSVT